MPVKCQSAIVIFESVSIMPSIWHFDNVFKELQVADFQLFGKQKIVKVPKCQNAKCLIYFFVFSVAYFFKSSVSC